MSDHCCSHAPASTVASPAVRRVLWIALAVNAAMFAVELAAGAASGSVSLLADSIDFFGDAANYALSLAVLGMAAATRSKAALVKAATMGLFGVFVLARALWGFAGGAAPEAVTMGVVGTAALVANVGVALLLWKHRGGDANLRSAWICSRNDAIGNLAVMGAAVGVWGAGSAWPDLVVAGLMAALAISGAASVVRQAVGEMRAARWGHSH